VKFHSLKFLCDKLKSAMNNYNDYLIVKCRIEITDSLDIIYEGCPICLKKGCTNHNKDKLVYYKIKLILLDEKKKENIEIIEDNEVNQNGSLLLKENFKLRSTFFNENALKLMKMEPIQWKALSNKKKQEVLENISKCFYLLFVHIKFKQNQIYFENNYRVMNIDKYLDQ
jgi:hypothetical protein